MAIPYAAREAYDPRGSRIADLILAAGNARARGAQQSGEIMGNTLGSLGQLIGGAITQRAKDQEQAPLKAAQLKSLNLGNEGTKLENESKRKQAEDQRATSTALAFSVDPAAGSIDPQRALLKLKDMGRPDLAPVVMGIVNQHQAASEAIRQRQMGWQAIAQDMTGEYAKMIQQRPEAERLAYAQHILPSLPKEAAAMIQPVIEKVSSGEFPLGDALDFLIKSSPSEQKRQAEIAAKNSEQKIVAPGAALVAGGKEVYRNAEAAPKGPINVAPGGVVFDPSLGKPIYTAPRAPVQPSEAGDDRVFQQERTVIDKLAAPIEDRAARAERLIEAVNARTPAADALIAPELLTVMAGGTGSGLRMSEAELEKIRKGRSRWEDIRAAVQKWNPNSGNALEITDSQRAQIRDLITAVNAKSAARLNAIDAARQALIDTSDKNERRKITANLRSLLGDSEALAATGASSGNPFRKPKQ